MRLLRGVLFTTILGVTTTAQDSDVHTAPPSYKAVAGVVGVVGCHSSAMMGELMTIWRREFERHYPAAHVDVDDASFQDVGAGAATFGPWRGRAGEPRMGSFKERFGYALVEIPVCLGVLAAYVREDNPYKGGLRLDQLASLCSSLSQDMTWGDLGCGGEWAKAPICLFVSSRNAKYFLWDKLGFFGFKESATWCNDDEAVLASVKKDPRGLGIALLGPNTRNVRPLTIAPGRSSDFVEANADNARSGSYPLTDTFCLTLNFDPHAGFELDALRRELLRYMLSKEGQQAVVRAGYVALSADQAEQALARLRVTPTGEASWDPMLSNLRVRRLPAQSLRRVEHLVRLAGDRPNYDQLVQLASTLAGTELASSITIATDEAGATVCFRFLGRPKAGVTGVPINRVEATVSIGIYNIWTERDGQATSPPDAWFPIVRKHERIKIYETRPRAVGR